MHKNTSSRRDFAADSRLLGICAIAVGVAALSTLTACLLLWLIRFFTNLFFFQTMSGLAHSPAANTLGAWVIAVPVVGGMIIGVIARFGSEKIRGHGIPEAIEAILFGKSKMSAKVAILKPLSSGIAIGSGGPFGAEGPIIMTGGALGSLIAQQFHLSGAERKTLLVAGAVAGMTAVFNTPIAAVLLAVELLLFELRPRSLLPVALACATAGFLRPLLLDDGAMFPLHVLAVAPMALFSCLLAGLAAGALAWLLSTSLYKVEDLFSHLPIHWMWWPALGGLAVGVGGYIEPRALGVGYDVIGDLLQNHLAASVIVGLLACKAIMWVIALGSGTSGGVLAPLLMLGAGLGALLGPYLPGGQATLWPAVFMAATLGGMMRAPVMAVIFGLELTHEVNLLLPLLAASSVAYGFTVLTMGRSILTEKIARRGYHIFREYGIDPLERHTVGEVMSHPVTSIAADTGIGHVLAAFFGQAQIHRAYPVVRDGVVLGMIERAMLQENTAWSDDGAQTGSESESVAVGALFEADPPMVALADESCRVVGNRLAQHGLERMPVVDSLDTMRLLGIVSRSDLLKPSRNLFDDEERRERFHVLPFGQAQSAQTRGKRRND